MENILSFFPGIYYKQNPYCNTCIYQKLGLTTLCEKYKRIPSDVQRGKYCVKYLRNEVE